MTFKDWFAQDHDRELGTRIKDATHISMQESRREKMRADLAEYARMRPLRVASRTQKSQHSWFSFTLHPMPVMAVLLVVALGSGSAGAASLAQNALPGDLLYPIKVNVNEEVRAAFATTPAAKAEVAIARAETRIQEIETLEERGAIDTKTREEVDARLDAQVRTAEEKSLETDDDNGERGARENRLVALLRKHETLLVGAEIGGASEPDVSVSTLIALDASNETDTSAPDAPAMMMTVSEKEDSGEKTDARKATVESEEQTQNTQAADARVSERVVARQMRAAEYRVESLEKLIDRMEKYTDANVFAQLQADLADAQEAFNEGETLFDNEAFTDASVRFNAAMRIAIDARETLSDTPRTYDIHDSRDDEKTDEDKGDSRSSRDTKETLSADDEPKKDRENNTNVATVIEAVATTTATTTSEKKEAEDDSRDDNKDSDKKREEKEDDEDTHSPSFIKNFFRFGN